MFFGNKRYNNFGSYLKHKFGERVYKVCIDAGFTCPNRDGSKGEGGCIYCNNDSFSPGIAKISVLEQLNRGIEYQKKRYNAKKFIAYFQSYTSTYGSIEYLRSIYEEALNHPEVVGLSIGTRPDCVNDEIMCLLDELSKKTYLWVEYGLQSMHDKTLELINRGHNLDCFHNTYIKTRKYKDINICVHVIHGLPLETRQMQLETIKYLSSLNIDAIKIHQLHVVKNTILEGMYRKDLFELISLEEYLSLIGDSLSLLSPDVIIQRLFGLGPVDILLAPDWNLRKGQFNTLIDNYLEDKGIYQGLRHSNNKLSKFLNKELIKDKKGV